MHRRDILKVGSMIGIGIVLPKLTFAQSSNNVSTDEVIITGEIGNNHGHELVISPKEALQALRTSKTSGEVFFDIEGSAGHTHSVSLNHENLLA